MIYTALLCLVVAVHDGDTLKVRCNEAVPHITTSVRLAYIDAPELGQPWGRASGQALRKMCLGKRATITPTAQDRYGRTVATVQCKGVDASRKQVERGMAWVYTRYAPANTPLAPLQATAQHHRRGLWHHPATPPHEWRNTRRHPPG